MAKHFGRLTKGADNCWACEIATDLEVFEMAKALYLAADVAADDERAAYVAPSLRPRYYPD